MGILVPVPAFQTVESVCPAFKLSRPPVRLTATTRPQHSRLLGDGSGPIELPNTNTASRTRLLDKCRSATVLSDALGLLILYVLFLWVFT